MLRLWLKLWFGIADFVDEAIRSASHTVHRYAHPERFPYICAYCGSRTGMPPYEGAIHEDGKRYRWPSYCYRIACIDRLEAIEIPETFA